MGEGQQGEGVMVGGMMSKERGKEGGEGREERGGEIERAGGWVGRKN
jgi:hypothetical protein